MGYIRHHAIVVTSWKDAAIASAHAKACELFPPAQVTPLGAAVINGYRSFAILPDGSKEGWEASDRADAARRAFLEWTRTLDYEDGSSPLSWVEVEFGGDDPERLFVHTRG